MADPEVDSGPVRYRWARAGDINAFCGLMFDNLSDLVIFTGILIGLFGYPADLVLTVMVPGTAVGVLVGDLLYTWLAFRLAKQTGRDDVTAMPLGLDTPSTFGLSFGVLGPAFLVTQDALLSWKIGMATIVLSGATKILGAWIGPFVRRRIPRAGLLGSIAAIAVVLIAYLPALEVFSNPVIGLVSFGIVLMTLIAHHPLPLRIPGAFAAVVAGTVLFYILGVFDLPFGGNLGAVWAGADFTFYVPQPSFAFWGGMSDAMQYLPLSLPLALAIVVGGIDVTESAAAAGDEYSARHILLFDGIATVAAGVCGGVLQSTAYIGHPAYKDMGGRAAYTLATAAFIGLGGMLGYVSFFLNLIPKPAIVPILIFIGLEIAAQAFIASPSRHAKAVAVAFIPVMAQLVLIELDQVIGALAPGDELPHRIAELYAHTQILGNGFVLTALMWGGAVAFIIDRKMRAAAIMLSAMGVFALFGVVHSPLKGAELFLPWAIESTLPYQMAAGYALLAGILLLFGRGPAPDVGFGDVEEME